jgi:hypothetical protein
MALKAYVGFALPNIKDIRPCVASHFTRLGYRLIDERTNEWVFERGNKLSALWRFDIRAYHTQLKVRSVAQKEGGTWVSCDWEVYTFMSLTTGADVATLEAEGHELESALRGMA